MTRNNRLNDKPKIKTGISINEEHFNLATKLGKDLNVGRSAIIDFLLARGFKDFDDTEFMKYFFKGEY